MTEHNVVDYQERRNRGLALYREIMCAEPPPLTTPRAATLIDFVFAEIWSRPGLERRARRLIAIDEMREVVLQFAAHAGWPKGSFLQQNVDQQWARIQEEEAAEG